ncbi:MAG: helix-turn-helix domain-containing protein [Ruminococcus bromii]|nr:helix-turn-helix domain-containing protein [Ruminococcus bromii]
MDKSSEIFSEYSDIVTVDEVMKMLRLGKNTVYKLLKDDKITNVKVGARYVIPKQSVIEFVSTTNRKS